MWGSSAPDLQTSHQPSQVRVWAFGHVQACWHEGEQKRTERQRPYRTHHSRVLLRSSLDPSDNVRWLPDSGETEEDFWTPQDAGVSHGAPALISPRFPVQVNKRRSYWRRECLARTNLPPQSEIWQHPPEDIFPSISLCPGLYPLFNSPLSIYISPSCCLLFPPDSLKVNICRPVAALERFKEHRGWLWTQPLMRRSGKDAERSLKWGTSAFCAGICRPVCCVEGIWRKCGHFAALSLLDRASDVRF